MMDVQRVFFVNCALLPPDKLIEAHKFIDLPGDSSDIKEKNKRLKEKLLMIEENFGIDLKLNNKF